MNKIIIIALLYIIVSARLDSQDPAVGKKNYSSNKQESDVMKYRRAAAMAKDEFAQSCGLNGYVWKQTTVVQTQVVSGFEYTITGKVTKGDNSRTVEVTVMVPAGQDTRLQFVGCRIVG